MRGTCSQMVDLDSGQLVQPNLAKQLDTGGCTHQQVLLQISMHSSRWCGAGAHAATVACNRGQEAGDRQRHTSAGSTSLDSQ